MKHCVLLLLCLLLSYRVFPGGEEELVLHGNRSVYGESEIMAGLSFPPFADARQRDFTTEQLENLAMDRVRFAIDWRNREPGPGEYYWDPMDRRMEAAKEGGISVFLTIGSLCPDWARLPDGSDGACLIDEKALADFIEALLVRYDNIDKIQFGNEWETKKEDATGYTAPDSLGKFVAYNNILYEAVQRLSPDTKVVLGGLTRTYPIMEYFTARGMTPDFSGIDLKSGYTTAWLEQRIAKMEADYDNLGIKENVEYVFTHADYDILDIHLYDDPENWSEYLSLLPRDKPILVSEFGGPNSEFENTRPYYQAARMEAYLDAIEKLPVTEAYYFKLVDSDHSYHQDSGLYNSNLKMKPARNVFARRLTPY